MDIYERINALTDRKDELVGKTVYDAVQYLIKMRNNGDYSGIRYTKKKNIYVNEQQNWKEIVKDVSYHRGYGYAQINVVLHI